MSPARTGGILLLVLAFAAGSWVAWWMVPLGAALWGFLRPPFRRPAAMAAGAAAAAAILWLVRDALAGGDFGSLARRMGVLLSLPAAVVLAAAVLFPALLAWSGAAVGAALRPRGRPTPSTSNP